MPDVAKPDARFAGPLFALDTIELEVVEGQTFREQDVWLDGRLFVNCEIVGCRLFVQLGVFGINGGHIHHCGFMFRGPARNVAMMIQTNIEGTAKRDAEGR